MAARKYSAVRGWIEIFVAMPGGGGGAGLRLAIADDAGDDQVGAIKGGAEGGRESIAQLSPFMNDSWIHWTQMAGKRVRPRKVFDEALQSRSVWGELREIPHQSVL